MVTISTHNGSAVHQAHNIRAEKTVSKEEHIDPNGIHETWIHESERHAYHRLFDESVKAYNEGQSRADRQIKNYYNTVRDDVKKHTSYEMIIGIYGKDENGVYQCTEEQGKEIMREFVEGWKERNPNLELIGAYYHADEQGEPHCHIDYIPVAHGYSRGMETQTGLVKALGEMGFEKVGKVTAQIQWEKRENDYLTQLCEERGLEVSHPKQEGREHLAAETYKAEKALESTLGHTRDLLTIQDDIRAETSKLEAIRDKAEKQAEKGLERKQKAFSRSWKKDKESGWNYDRGLEKEIKALVKERAEDVKAISHTNLDIEREYDVARESRIQAQKEAERTKALAEQELAKAQEYKANQEAYIRGTSEKMANQMFREFIQKEFGTTTRGRGERLEEYCEEIKFKDGRSVLDKFEEAEIERKQELERSWDRGWSR